VRVASDGRVGTTGPAVVVRGAFDGLRSADVRFLEACHAIGPVHVLLRGGRASAAPETGLPRLPAEERRYLLASLRWVDGVWLVDGAEDETRAVEGLGGSVVARSRATTASDDAVAWRSLGIGWATIPDLPGSGSGGDSGRLHHPVPIDRVAKELPRPRVIVTGCYDWLHSGHVRFFEEAAALGALAVAVGNDESVRAFKGPQHPMFAAAERRYLVSSVRHVAAAVIATGSGWLDAASEIERLAPESWVVNEDGDRPEKRALAERLGVAYRVFRRRPAPGLPVRSSTALRGY